MRLKTKITIAAVSVAAVVTAGSVVAIRTYVRRRRHKAATSFLSADVRDALQELCSLEGSDFVPDKLGSSIYSRRLESLTDRQLIGVYVTIKVVEALRIRGVDIQQLSKDDLFHELSLLQEVVHNKNDRRDLLRRLGMIGVETTRGILSDGLLIAGIAAKEA